MCYERAVLSVGYKNYFGDKCFILFQATLLIYPIFKVATILKLCKLDNFDHTITTLLPKAYFYQYSVVLLWGFFCLNQIKKIFLVYLCLNKGHVR